MNENLEKVQDAILEKVNHICREFGLNNIMAQLYALLYLSDKPVSLDDMVDRLKISKGSVSVNIRALERYGATKRVWVKGSRRDHYEAETNISKVILDRIKSISQKRLLEIGNVIDVSSQVLKSSNSSGSNEDAHAMKVCAQRLSALKSFYNQAQSLFNLLNSGLVTKALNIKNKSIKETSLTK